MKQVLIRRGGVLVENVPAPLVAPGHVLVQVAYSLISTGTELSSVRNATKPLVSQALEQPSRVRKLTNYLRAHGVRRTVAAVRARLDASSPTGYSCSGTVVQVGDGVTGLSVGDRVACAGAGLANHAELVLIPSRLVTRLPEACSLRDGACVTVGSIALQGVRRADLSIGDLVVVIGLGLVGQITVQLLKIAGCRTIGIDLDSRRVALGCDLGLDDGIVATSDVQQRVDYLSSHHGADCTLITAASRSNGIVQQAMELTRTKGRVVVVGAVSLGLERSPFYEKEIDLLISRSYGPGRYDPTYEEQGVDYPYPYVRWTENRNMAEFARLLAEGRVNVAPLVEEEYPVDAAENAYQALSREADRPVGVMLSYPSEELGERDAGATCVPVRPRTVRPSGKINVALVGPGSFAQSVHLPNLETLGNTYNLRAVVSGTGANAKGVSERYGAEYASTDLDDVLSDDSVDMVMICARHHLHASMAMRAAKAGKAVFVEKPMAVSQEELDDLVSVLQDTGVPYMVGFNRRFSPAARRIRELTQDPGTPLAILYRVNAGYIPAGHWVHGPQGGGRIVGEACHMLDLFKYLASETAMVAMGSVPYSHSLDDRAASLDSVSAVFQYANGSTATLVYCSAGGEGLGKEYAEIHGQGMSLVLDDYRDLRVYGVSEAGWHSPSQDKGHLDELEAFARYVRGRSGPPIPLTSLVETTEVSFGMQRTATPNDGEDGSL